MAGIENDLGQLAGDIIFVTSVLLGNRRSDANRRRGDVLPEEHVRSALGGIESEKLAILLADRLEQVHDLEGVQVVHGLPGVLLQLRCVFLGLLERSVEFDLALGGDLLLSGRLVVRRKLVVDELHDAQLPNDTLDRAAVWARPGLPALLVDPLQNCRPSQVVDSGAAQLLQELAALGFHQEDSRTVLADVL